MSFLKNRHPKNNSYSHNININVTRSLSIIKDVRKSFLVFTFKELTIFENRESTSVASYLNPHFTRDEKNNITAKLYYDLINRAWGPYEEIFVLTFKAYGPNAVCQNKYFLYGPKSQLIRAFLYTCTNKIPYDEIFTELEHCLLR